MILINQISYYEGEFHEYHPVALQAERILKIIDKVQYRFIRYKSCKEATSFSETVEEIYCSDELGDLLNQINGIKS